MGYERNKIYKIYYSFTEKINKTQDVDINKSLLHNKSDFKPLELANNEWKNSDNSFIAASLEFEDKKAETNIKLA